MIFNIKAKKTSAVSSKTSSSTSILVLSIGTWLKKVYQNRENFDNDLATTRKTSDNAGHASSVQIQDAAIQWCVLPVNKCLT